MSSRHLLLSLLLLPLPSLVVHADLSPISRAFQVETVVASGRAFGAAISGNAYDLGTLSFDALDSLASLVNVASNSGTGSVIPICTPGMTVSVALDYGTNGGSSSQHYLKRMNDNETLAYQLYQDAAYSQVWSNGTLARTIANFPASTQIYTVYAHLPVIGDLPPAGNYRDAVTVTLSF